MKKIRFIFALLLSWLPCLIQAQVIPVNEVQTSIHEKQVTGYRFTIKKSHKAVRSAIRRNFDSYPISPTILEGIIIYENLLYPPVTSTHPITLYYLLENVEGIFTNLTVVGMYDYQRSINSRDYPDLSLRLLLDVSEIVEATTGDTLQFDHIFQQTTASSLQEKYKDRKAQNDYDFYLVRKQDWVGDEGATLMKTDPFGDKKPKNIKGEDELVAQISQRFDKYVEKTERSGSPFADRSSVRQIQVFQDSIVQLKEALALARLPQVARSGTNPDLRKLQMKVDSLARELKTSDSSARVAMEWADARLSALYKQVKANKALNESLEQDLAKAKESLSLSKQQVAQLKLDTSTDAPTRESVLTKQVEQLKQELKDSQSAISRYQTQITQLEKASKLQPDSSYYQGKINRLNEELAVANKNADTYKEQLAIASSNKDVSQKEVLLTKQVEELKKKLTDEQTASSKYKSQVDELTQSLDSKSTSVDTAEYVTEIELLTKNLEAANKKIADYKVQLSTAEKSLAATGETNNKEIALQREVEILSREKERITTELETSRKAKTIILREHEELKKQFAEKEKEISLQASTESEKVQQLSKDLAASKSETDAVKKELEKTQDSEKSISQRMATALLDLSKAEAERERLQGDVAELSQQLQQTLDQSAEDENAIKQHLSQAKSDLKKADSDKERLNTELIRVSKELDKTQVQAKKDKTAFDADIALAKKTVAESTNKIKQLQVRNEQLIQDIQIVKKTAQEEQSSLETRLKAAQTVAELEKAEKVALAKEVNNLSKANTLLESDNAQKTKLFVSATERADSLDVVMQSLGRKYRYQKTQIDSLQTEVALLNPDSESAKARRQIYDRQLDNLVTNRREMSQREQQVSTREKRIEQREKYLAEFESSSDKKVLLERIAELEKQMLERDKTTVEEVSDSKILLAPIKIEASTVYRSGKKIPFFVVKSDETERQIRDRIIRWFARLGLPSSNVTQGIKYSDAIIRQISDSPITVKFDFSKGTDRTTQVLCSFQFPDGSYIESEFESLTSKKVKVVLKDIFD